MKKFLRNIIWGLIGFLTRIRAISPIGIAKLKHLEMLHRWPDFRHPKDVNEKINWLKFNTDTSSWVSLSDKFAVRKFVELKGLGEHLVKLYGNWDDATKIDWNSLPKQFIIKPNNGSGDVLICNDKSSLDTALSTKYLATLLNKRYGLLSAEPHYAMIKPSLIAEELLNTSSQPCGSTSMVDYKIWCFSGTPAYVMCCSNRTKDTLELSVYDLDWNYHPEFVKITSHYIKPRQPIPRPVCFDEMLSIASILSEGFPESRVDLYEVDGKVYFGEITFTSAGGFMNYYTDEFLRILGDKVQLPERDSVFSTDSLNTDGRSIVKR